MLKIDNLQSINKIRVFLGCLIAFLMPFNHVMALKMFALFLCFVLALPLLGKTFRKNGLLYIFLFWVGAVFLSVFYSVDIRYSLSEYKSDFFYSLIGFVCIYQVSLERPVLIAKSIFFGWLTNAVLGLLWFFSGRSVDWFYWQHGVGQYSTYLVIVTPFIIWFLKNKPWYCVGAIFFNLCLLVLVPNRMAWICLLFYFVFFAGFFYKKIRFGLNKKILSIGGIVLFALIAGLLIQIKSKPVNALAPEVSGNVEIIKTFTQNERFGMWKFWLEKGQEHQWLGVGYGKSLPSRLYIDQMPTSWFSLMKAHAHNIFINTWLQSGWLGLLAFCMFIYALCRKFYLQKDISDKHRLLSYAVLMIVGGAVLKNFTDDFFSRNTMFIVFGLFGYWLAILNLVNSAGDNNAHCAN
ncbi:O-antigen ligase family protein [Leeia sp. TBRC 13508]|uniref:O-antigen ligase family protein n=1 Tax=Leeia speluncae TaxID=2884804 RepID=A0ABS8D5A8_9NEIS|nr:O-antigen ligase family protein [Leeia speluncae]MCB6183380.1 O-antigen ligase family protein [Leeia speluncae]